jgi:hypothetical protein
VTDAYYKKLIADLAIENYQLPETLEVYAQLLLGSSSVLLHENLLASVDEKDEQAAVTRGVLARVYREEGPHDG